ncbi:MAG: mandelate racemase/muconate lactonizing enzyme family protein [Trueperaceae bacterium]|nr:mandelate racemase/muconate lactonizing enzyme family protein [Trueperaceae bacterium]
MKIEHIEAMVVKAPVPGIESWQAASFAVPFRWAESTLVKVTTDDGTVGWGEVHAPVAPEVTKSIVDVLIAPALLGADPLDTAPLWDRMYALMRPRGHALGFMPEAMSGVDIALFDIAGKALGVPCYTLLGGLQQARVRTYASVLQWLEPHLLAEVAARHRDAGFTAMKLKVGQDPAIDRRKVEAARGAVGLDMDLMADANCRYTVAEAVAMARVLEEHAVVWFEEPLPPEDVAGYRELRSKVDVAIAGGECECTHYRFGELLAQRTFDVIQPDICRAGGLTACHRIGVLASAHNVRVAPHVSIGSAIHIVASLHWAASERQAFIHEYPVFDNPLVDDLLTDPIDWRDGHLHVGDAPGLGMTVREDVVERYRVA